MADQIVAPGEEISPKIDLLGAIKLAERLYGIKVKSAKELVGYDDKNYHLQVTEHPNNKYMPEVWPHGYVMKIMNSSDSKKLDYIEAQCEIMIHLDKHGVMTPQPQKNTKGRLFSLEKIPNKDLLNEKEHAVRILTYQEGTIIKDVPWTFTLQYEVGRYTANLDLVLKDFSHPAYEKYSSLWCLKNAPKIKDYLFILVDKDKLSLVKTVITHFEDTVLSVYDSLQSGMIHGDINEQNLLCTKDNFGEWHVSSVLDLGDSHYSAHVFELALAATYMILWSEQIESGKHVIAGYCNINPLPLHELKLMKTCVCARLCQSLVLGLYTYSQHPTNEYVLTTQAAGWKILETLWTTDFSQIEHQWFGELY